MSRVLVVYSTNSGSTGEVAQQIGDELMRSGHAVEVLAMRSVSDLSAYDAVIIGAPMILGWHAAARQFVRKHKVSLAAKKTAYFACAMRLTRVEGERLPDVKLTLDANLVDQAEKPGSLNLKERFTTLGYYLAPMLRAAPQVQPLSLAFFKGKLEMFRLKWYQALFVMVAVQATPGDYRDWKAIKAWAADLSSQL